jgi:hypothetical protein
MGYVVYSGRSTLKAQDSQVAILKQKIEKKREEVALLGNQN